MTDETGSNFGGSYRGNNANNGDSRTSGLISVSFEGNPNIGDRGAQAIATLI